MTRYKICPSCGAHNDPTAIECIECEEDLTTVKITDEDTEQKAKLKQETATKEKVKKIKICYCGAKNPANARKCSECGDDISTVIPQVDTAKAPKKWALVSDDGSYKFELDKSMVIIGRDKEMADYLADKSYVSRVHAEIMIKDDKIYLKSTGTNHTFINNVQIPDNEPVEVKSGDSISFGGNEKAGTKQAYAAYFKLESK